LNALQVALDGGGDGHRRLTINSSSVPIGGIGTHPGIRRGCVDAFPDRTLLRQKKSNPYWNEYPKPEPANLAAHQSAQH
jgi:hypothetical protein